MKDSKWIRKLDSTLGRWACAALGSWIRLWPQRQPIEGANGAQGAQGAQRVLLIELFEMGAAVMLRPSLQYLLRANPKIEIHVLTTSMCAAVWLELEEVAVQNIHVLSASSPWEFIVSNAQTVLSLRKNKFFLIIDYGLFMRVPALLSASLRAWRRAGFYKYGFEGLDRGNFYTTRCAFNQNSHIAKNYLALTQAAFEQVNDTPNLKRSFNESEVALAPLSRFTKASSPSAKPYIVISPDVGVNLSVRNYPYGQMLEVLQKLQGHYPHHSFVFVGTAQNRQRLLADAQGQRLLLLGKDMLGQTDFPQLLALLKEADLLICNDNGPAHFAALTGTKTLALFSTDSPFMYGPLSDAVIAYSYFQCSPCISALNHKTTPCDNNLCLQSLKADEVCALAISILQGRAKFRTINNRVSYLPSPQNC